MTRSLGLGGAGTLTRLTAHVRTPLFGNAYALILSGAATSALGILYWTLAARLFNAADVGVNAAAISAMTFISYLAQLNMGGVLSRFIPTAGPATRRLILIAYLVVGAISAGGAWIFVLGFAGLVGLGPMLTVDPRLGAWFVAATAAWSLFTLQDGALTGLRQAVWVPIENTIFGATKIALLLLLAGGLAGSGIFVSWTIPAALLVVPVNWLIFRRLVPRHVAVANGPADVLQPGIVRYLSGDYIGSLFNAGTIGLLPLVVVGVVGPSGGAYYYVSWTIAYSMCLISLNMATSLMVEGATRGTDLALGTQRIFRLLVGLQTLLVVVVVIDAPLVLGIFNPDYASQAETLLRLLALAVLPHGVNAIYLALARVRRQVGRVIAVQATTATISLAGSAALLGSMGIAGAGVAWLVAQSTVALVLVTTQLVPLWRRSPDGISNEPDSSGADRGERSPVAPPPPLLASTFAALDEAGIRWCVLRGDPEDRASGARDVDLLVAADDLPRLDPVLTQLDLIKVPGYGRGPGGFFVGRDGRSGSWVHLDVAADLCYGRFSQFETGAGAGCVARRLTHGGIAVPHPDDAFWALFLHCALDKGFAAPRHVARLQTLVDEARDDGPPGALVASILPAGWGPSRIRAAVRAGQWSDLAALRRAILLRLWLRDPLRASGRVVVRIVARGAGMVRLVRRRWGVSVALLGPDGAGKTTLASAISADFGLPVHRIYMGMWSSSEPGIVGRVPGLAIAARPFAAARKALVAQYHRAHGRLVIFDRYTYDALIPPRGRLKWLKRPYFWILAHAAPAPQLVIVLDAPGPVLFARKGEFDPIRLEEDRLAFRDLAGRVDRLRVVDASQSPDSVRAEVTSLIWRQYLQREEGR